MGELNAVIAELKARHDIHDVLVRYCRGADRCDARLMRSCFHDDAIDDHGFFNGSATAFADQAAVSLAERFVSTRHLLSNVYVMLDGEEARSEAYVTATMRVQRDDVLHDVTFAARYLDLFQRRDGIWRIAHRRLVSDGTRVDRVSDREPRMERAVAGARGPADPAHPFFARTNQEPLAATTNQR